MTRPSDNHNDAGASLSKIELCDARDDNDDNATMPRLSREGAEVETGAAVAKVGTVAMTAAQTTIETVGAGSNQQNAAAAAAVGERMKNARE